MEGDGVDHRMTADIQRSIMKAKRNQNYRRVVSSWEQGALTMILPSALQEFPTRSFRLSVGFMLYTYYISQGLTTFDGIEICVASNRDFVVATQCFLVFFVQMAHKPTHH